MFLALFAEGFEEIEGVTTVDLLKRAEIEVKTVGIGCQIISGAHGIMICCDTTDRDMQLNDEIEGVILPGGMPGTLNLENSDFVQELLSFCNKKGKWICAICAAPTILGHQGFLKGRRATCFPGMEKELEGAATCNEFICRDRNIITAKGPGASILFGLNIIETICGTHKAQKIKESLQCP